MTRKMKDSGVEWIGMIPEGWNISKVSRHFDIQLGKMLQPTPSGDSDSLEQYLCAANFGNNTAKLSSLKQMWFSESDKKTFGVSKGDLMVVEGGDVASSAFVDEDVSDVYFQNSLHRVRPKIDESNRILRYILMTAKNVGQIDLVCNKATIAHFTKDKFGSLAFPLMPLQEQNRIADYLDSKCAAIDDVIAKTNESIEEYKKLKQAVITEAVTKGVRGKRPMKDSDVDWIGQVPSDWNLQRIKTLFDLRTELNFKPLEEVNLISLYTDKGVVQHADLEKTTGNKAMNADGYKVVYENDIVVNIILCWMGAIGRSAYNGVTSPAYDVYCPKNGVESQFYHYYFRTAGFNGECFTRGRGIMLMRWRTYSDQFRDIRVVVPPQAEQKEIVKYLDSKCAAIDTLISKKQQFIDELTAYKKSLIYEYVTGKKEVPA